MAKRAFLIGINRYQVAGSDLRGCVNDVKDLSAALIEFHGFRKSDISVVTDLAATKKAMEAGIKALVRASKKGDVAVLHYSGHGSHVPDDNRDESDGRDETLCPADLDWDEPFRDDWLRKTLDGMNDGVRLTVIMDCCHSGTNTRAIVPPDAPVKERYLPSPFTLKAVESGCSAPKKVSSELRASSRAARKARDIVTADIPELLVTGCRDTQTSADAYINGRFNGALTFSLVQAIRKARGKLTYREWHDRAAAELKRRRFEQVPQLEGMAKRFDEALF
jgi:hypothetical protein